MVKSYIYFTGILFLFLACGENEPQTKGKDKKTATSKNYVPKHKTPGGIGIDNVKKRLELGYTKDEYQLDIHNLKNEFIVDLKLKLR